MPRKTGTSLLRIHSLLGKGSRISGNQALLKKTKNLLFDSIKKQVFFFRSYKIS